MASYAKPLAKPHHAEEHEEDPRQHLMHDPLPRGQMNAMVMESMHSTSPIFWVVAAILAAIVVFALGYEWYVLIMQGQGMAGVTRPDYWGVFLVNTVFWIGISHAGTFISAILRVLKVESRRPFTRAAELMTTFGLVQAGLSIFMHLGRVWLTYWMFPLPNQRTIWPDFHSPLMWDLMAITTYLLCSTMYLFLPLIPDMAMARDRTEGGWLKVFYKTLALGFRGTEGEWKNLVTAMNIFAFAIIPVMFSVHTIVSWDFAMASRPGWNSTVFGPYFVIGALHSGMAAVAIVLFLWNRKWRETPWLLSIVGIFINIGMYLERYIIIPVGVTINRMPFTWRQYEPRIEIPMTVGTFALFLLLYMLASRLIPLIPVWEVQEGQEAHILRKIGKAEIPTLSEME